MKLFTTLALILITRICFGQILFYNIYSKQNFDYGDAVIERYDGKYLIAGCSRSQFDTDYDVNILLVDSVGQLVWDKYIGQTSRYEFVYSLIESNDSNYVVVGRVASGSIYLMKFDSSGSMIWEKEFQSSFTATDAFSVGQTFDDNYFFVRTDSSSTLFLNNTVGDTLWTSRYDFAYCQSVVQTSDSGFALTGINNPWSMNSDIILIKTNAFGDTLWTKSFGGAGNDDAKSIQQLSDDGYIIAGNFDTQIADVFPDTYIIRTNAAGDTIWTRKYYLGTAHYIQECDYNNGYILSTIQYSMGFPVDYSLFISKLDTLGSIQWSRQFQGYTYGLGNNITQTSDGGYLLTGYINTVADIELIKLDSLGNFVSSIQDFSSSSHSQVLSFPNPATDEINFVLANSSDRIGQLTILGLVGEEIKILKYVNENHVRVDLGKLNEGFFIYELKTTDGKTETGKFAVIK